MNWEKKNETYITHNKGLLRRSCEKIRKQLLLIWKALLLGGNAIGDHGMHLLERAMKHNKVLTNIDLHHNNAHHEATLKIAIQVARNIRDANKAAEEAASIGNDDSVKSEL